MAEHSMIAWRRLDPEGREAAAVREIPGGWRLSGVADFGDAAERSCLAYVIECDRDWQTRECHITGFVRTEPISVYIYRDAAAHWTLDGNEAHDVAGCVDIDLAFSPITNMLPVRRLMLDVGDTSRVRAAWLRFPDLTLEVLDQSYMRIATDRYRYESADGAFRRELTVDHRGLVLDYPGMWIATHAPKI